MPVKELCLPATQRLQQPHLHELGIIAKLLNYTVGNFEEIQPQLCSS